MIPDKKREYEKLLSWVAFAFYFVITSYRLTYAPLWFDETVEYWYSKIMFGPLPFLGCALDQTTNINMYQRIISTFQPPLYNFIMFFWLKVNTSEWWFRFFGVLMGFAGNIGIYKTVKKNSNGTVAAVSVFLTSCIFRLVYYWQECAEYCLMLGSLCWTIYFFEELIREQIIKNIILFTVFSIIPVYSQYGAIFPVAAMLMIAYMYVLMKKEKRPIIQISVSYAVALVFAALPLVFLFLLKQIASQQNGRMRIEASGIDGYIIDMWKRLIEVVRWNLFSHCNKSTAFIFAVVFILCTIIVFVFTDKKNIRILVITNVMTWVFYYFSVKLGLYSYGKFGRRYDLFFIPLWIVLFFTVCTEVLTVIKEKTYKRCQVFSRLYTCAVLSLIIAFMYSNWTVKIHDNWSKEDMRGAVNAWFEAGAQDSNTLVYYPGDSGFLYYLQHDDRYTGEMEDKKIHCMKWYRNKTAKEYTEYIQTFYGDNWPSEIYVIASLIRDDLNTILSVMSEKGYTKEELFNHSDALLLRLSKS